MAGRLSFWARIRTGLDWLAGRQIGLVVLLAPIFLLADRWPNTVVLIGVLMIPLVWILHKVARGRFFAPTPVDVPLLLLLATLPIGFWASALPERSLPLLLQYLFAVTLFYALVNTFTSQAKIEWAGLALQAAAAAMVGLALAGTAWGGSKILPADFARLPYLLGPIWYSAGFHPNIVGGTLALLLPSTAAYALAARSWSRRLLFGILLLVGILALIMTQSRGAIAGFAAALLVVAIARRRRWAWLVLVLAVLVVAVILWLGAQQALELVLDSAGDGTAQSREARLELLSRGLYMVEDFPLTGVGLGMFPDMLSLLYPLFLLGAAPDVPHVHNVPLQMAIDHGLPGLIAFLAFSILLLVMAIRSLALCRGRRLEPLATGLLAGFVAYALHGLVDHIWHTPRSHPIIWAYFGLIAALWTSLQSAGGSDLE